MDIEVVQYSLLFITDITLMQCSECKYRIFVGLGEETDKLRRNFGIGGNLIQS